MKRTHNCGQLRKADVGQTVTLAGWVDRRRDHGGVIFVDLRDKYGKTQIVFNPDYNADVMKTAEQLRNEYVITVTGKVYAREEGNTNEKLATGEIEIKIDQIEILNAALTSPLAIKPAVPLPGPPPSVDPEEAPPQEPLPQGRVRLLLR